MIGIDWTTLIITALGVGVGYVVRHWQTGPVARLVDNVCKERAKQDELVRLREQLNQLAKENEQKNPE